MSSSWFMWSVVSPSKLLNPSVDSSSSRCMSLWYFEGWLWLLLLRVTIESGSRRRAVVVCVMTAIGKFTKPLWLFYKAKYKEMTLLDSLLDKQFKHL